MSNQRFARDIFMLISRLEQIKNHASVDRVQLEGNFIMDDEKQLSLLILITGIGKALIKKGLIEGKDISDELEVIKNGTKPMPKILELEIVNLIKATAHW